MDNPERKRKRSRWFLEWVLFSIAVLGFVAWQFYSRPVYVFLQTVTVVGNQKIDTAEIHQMAGYVSKRGPLWFWDAQEFFSRLREDFRVAEVKTQYEWPASLTIHIRERRSLAYIWSRHGMLDIDVTGTVMAISRNMKNMDAPMITGFRAGRVYPGDRISEPAVHAALEYLVSLNKETRDRLSEVHLSPQAGVVVITTDNIRIRLGNLERIREKARLTQDILQEVLAKGIPVESIDLAHEKPVLRFRI